MSVNRSIAFMQSRWVLEKRFSSSKLQIDEDLYVLRALHCLEGRPGATPFVSIILDDDNRIINGFLFELPAKGRIFEVIVRAENSGKPVALERREKWCRQIVQGVAEVHAKGFVIGLLGGALKYRVGINGDDNAVLYEFFERIFLYDKATIALLPPEYDRSTLAKGSIAALPQTDIYQLGLVLWRIVANKSSQYISEFCERAGCTATIDAVTDLPHQSTSRTKAPLSDFLNL
jgi:hypothetical protein